MMLNRDRPSRCLGGILGFLLGASLAIVPLHIQAQPTERSATLQRRGTRFSDVSTDHPASIYIIQLAEAGVISGFPDQSFRPEDPVTRAQFAAILRQAFPDRNTADAARAIPFDDVPSNHWAAAAIQTARFSGFLAGYPGNEFRPDQKIPRVQALVALNNGLDYVADETGVGARVLSYYQDADEIPDYAIASLRSATQSELVVSYPAVTKLNPNRDATRAEVAAFVYQAMAREGRLNGLADAPYVVQPSFATWPAAPNRVIPVTGQVRLNSSGDRLLTAQSAGFQVWDTHTGTSIAEVDLGNLETGNLRLSTEQLNNKSIAINAAGTQVAAVVRDTLTKQLSLRLWAVNSGQLLWQVPIDSASVENQVTAVEFRPRNDAILVYTQLATAESAVEIGPIGPASLASLTLHEGSTGATQVTFRIPASSPPQQLAFSRDGAKLVSYREQGQGGGFKTQIVDVWPLDQPQAVALGNVGESIILPKSPLRFRGMAFTTNGALRVLSQHLYDVRLDDWNLELSQRLQSVRSIGDVDRTDGLGVLSPDGEFYFVRSDVAGTRLINTKTYQSTAVANIARDAAFDHRGDTLAVATPTQIEIFRKVTPP